MPLAYKVVIEDYDYPEIVITSNQPDGAYVCRTFSEAKRMLLDMATADLVCARAKMRRVRALRKSNCENENDA